MVWKEANLLSLQIQSLQGTGDSGFDQTATFYQSDLASRGLNQQQVTSRLKNEFKRLKIRVTVEGYGAVSLSKMT